MAQNFQASGEMIPGLSKSFIKGFSKNEKKFQETMSDIYEKYNHPFEDDVVIDIFDLTYSTPRGPVPYNFNTKAATRHGDTTPKTVTKTACILSNPLDERSNDGLEHDSNTANDGGSVPHNFNTKATGKQEQRGKTPERVQNPALIQSCPSDDISSYGPEHDTARLLSVDTSDEDSNDNSQQVPEKRYEFKRSKTGSPILSFTHQARAKEACSSDGQSQSLMPYTRPNFGNKTFFVPPQETTTSQQINAFRKRLKDYSFKGTRGPAGYCPGNKTFIVQSSDDCAFVPMGDVFCVQKKGDTYEIVSCKEDQNRQMPVMKSMPVKRNVASMFHSIYSPKCKVACNIVADSTIVLEKSLTYQSRNKTNLKSSSYYNNMSQRSEVACSSSAFPPLKSPGKNAIIIIPNMDSEAPYKPVTKLI